MKTAVPTRPLAVSTILVVLATLLGFLGFVWWDYFNTRRAAERQLGDVARLMEEHVDATLEGGDLVLERVAELIGRRDPASLRGSDADLEALFAIKARLPAIGSILILDREGNTVLRTADPYGPMRNGSDRDYFKDARDGAGGLAVSPMIKGRSSGQLSFTFSRRLTDRRGGFAGVVVAGVTAEHFRRYYQDVMPERGAVFTLLRTDGAIVMRTPLPSNDEPARGDPELLLPLVRPGSGIDQIVSPIDGIERVYAHRRMQQHPLAVVTGLTLDGINREWRARTAALALLTAGCLGAFLFMVRRAYRGSRQLEQALVERDLLFSEVHHRVKNNLQIISSLFQMQSLQAPPDTQETFRVALDRIQSMSLVHETLYRKNEAAEVPMDKCLQELAAAAEAAYGTRDRGVAIEVDVAAVTLDLDRAVPVSLIVNEVAVNALKHAFPCRGGRVGIALARQDNQFVLTVQDDGVGMPVGVRKNSGLGLHLVQALSQQLGGRPTFESAAPGSRFRLEFAA